MKLHEMENLCVKDWVGRFNPKKIELIPLIEDKESLQKIDKILGGYLELVKANYLRVFLARSDPALNYGLFPAVLLVKLALSKIRKVSQEHGVEMFPIVGTGSLPFRGHLTPTNVNNFLQEYAGVKTVTVQSALKYDYEKEDVKKTIEKLNTELLKRDARVMTEKEEDGVKKLIKVFTENYQEKVEKLSRFINYVAKFIPKRRARKLHIGLFGYSRQMGSTKLPRAIEFTAVMYSLGLPPELIGASALASLSEEDWELLDKYYTNWREDIRCASGYFCWQNLNYLMGEREVINKITEKFGLKEVIPEMMKDLQLLEQNLGINLGPRSLDQRKHENIANNILISLVGDERETVRYISEAGRIRHSLG